MKKQNIMQSTILKTMAVIVGFTLILASPVLAAGKPGARVRSRRESGKIVTSGSGRGEPCLRKRPRGPGRFEWTWEDPLPRGDDVRAGVLPLTRGSTPPADASPEEGLPGHHRSEPPDGPMSFHEAVNFPVRMAKLERPNARRKWAATAPRRLSP